VGESPSIVDLAPESLSSSRFLYALRGDAGRQKRHLSAETRRSKRSCTSTPNGTNSKSSTRYASPVDSGLPHPAYGDEETTMISDRSFIPIAHLVGDSPDGSMLIMPQTSDAPWVSQHLSRTLRNEPENSPQL
jgi:hypothetical protein